MAVAMTAAGCRVGTMGYSEWIGSSRGVSEDSDSEGWEMRENVSDERAKGEVDMDP